MRVALVDDKKELRDHVAMLLGEFAAEQRLHYKLDCFASGEDFLNHFTAHSYDIIFMDMTKSPAGRSIWWKRRSRSANLTAM